MGDVVLEIRVAREVLRHIGCEQRLNRARQAPEIAHFHRESVPGPQGRGRDQDGHVAKLQRKRLGEPAARHAAEQQVDPPADLVHHQEPLAWSFARGNDQTHGRYCDHKERGDMLGRQQAAHPHSEPGSSHSGLTPRRWNRERRGANQR